MKFEKLTFTTAVIIVCVMISMAAWTSTLIGIHKHYEDTPKISDIKTQEAIQTSIELREDIYAYLEELEAE